MVFQKGNKNPNKGQWSGPLAHRWKGNNITHAQIHRRIKQVLSKPDLCKICSIKSACDLANVSGEYRLDIDDWQWLCRKCHMISDNRIRNLDRTGQKPWNIGKKTGLIPYNKGKKLGSTAALKAWETKRRIGYKATPRMIPRDMKTGRFLKNIKHLAYKEIEQ